MTALYLYAAGALAAVAFAWWCEREGITAAVMLFLMALAALVLWPVWIVPFVLRAERIRRMQRAWPAP